MERNAQLSAWLEGSAFMTGTEPVIWHHATDRMEPFGIFTRWEEFSLGFHFGNAGAAQARAEGIGAEEHRIISVYCRARNPLRLRDHHGWGLRNIVNELVDTGIIDEETADIIREEGDEMLFAALELAGHDCIIYHNETEGRGDSLMIWRADLVKSVDAAGFYPDDPRLDPGEESDEFDLRSYESLIQAIETEKHALLEMQSRQPAP